MSQSAPKPHSVKVYGIATQDGRCVLSVFEDVKFDSKSAAEKYASEKRKQELITSACVYATPTETAAA